MLTIVLSAIIAVLCMLVGWFAWRERDMARKLDVARVDARFATDYADNMCEAVNALREQRGEKLPEKLPPRIVAMKERYYGSN